MKEVTRWACWDCEKEFKPMDRKRRILDEGVPTSVCNKCYSKRIKK